MKKLTYDYMDVVKIIQEDINRIFRFKEEDVPKEVVRATKEVVSKLVEYEKVISDDEWKIFNFKKGKIDLNVNRYGVKTWDFSFDDLFFEDLSINIKLFKRSDVEIPYEVIGKSNRSYLLPRIVFAENDKINKSRIDLYLCYNDKIDNTITYGIISHELSHLFGYFEKNKEELWEKHKFYNILHNNIEESSRLNKISFLFYCMCYFELNANIVALYHELYYHKYVNSYEEALQWYYETNTYQQFLKNLEHPEIILNNEFLRRFDEYDLENLNSNINDVLKLLEDKENGVRGRIFNLTTQQENKIKKRIYFDENSETLEQYIERIKNICKRMYQRYFKRVEDVIKKVVDDKVKDLTNEELDLGHKYGGLERYLE